MPGQQDRFIGGGLKYPYVEGLRLDEAMHPLTLMTVGVYGKALPPQNGAPVRLIVPWKYGFKGIKSIDRFVAAVAVDEYQPVTLVYLARAVTPGTYQVPQPMVESMYVPQWRATGAAEDLLIVRP